MPAVVPVHPSEMRAVRPTLGVAATSSENVQNASGTIRIIRYDAKYCEEITVNSIESIKEYLSSELLSRIAPRRSGSASANGNANASTNANANVSANSSANAVETKSLAGGNDSASNDSSASNSASVKRTTWINVDGVGDPKLLDALGKLFGLHPLALEDVVNVHQHAKLECYGNHMYFVARMPTTGAKFATEQVSLFLVNDIVITIQERPGDCLDPVRHRIAKSVGRIRRRGADYLAYAIIDAIIDGYFPVLEPYDEELDRASDDIAGGNQNLPLRLHQIRADLLLIRKVLLQHRDALNNLMREGADLVTPDTALYFRDCQDHINRLIEAADTDRETCGELRELYFAMLGEKNNAVMKVLTIIATIFIPMSFVAGLYGMNFDSSVSALNMPELRWAFGYPFALTMMGLLAGGLLYYLYRKGWLS